MLRDTLTLAFLLLLTACVSDGSASSPARPPGTTATGGTEEPIILTRYACGDNCYVSYVRPAAPADTLQALCAAPLCGKWERWGELPDGLKNQPVLARFSVGRQYDGAGTIMREDYPSITAIRIGSSATE